MGSRGPVPKRSDARVRRNVESRPDTLHMPGEVRPPPASRTWHRRARAWYLSLRRSGQSRYFEPSDWEQARLLAELLSDELEQPTRRATMVNAILAAMRGLGTTEADRRRMRLEIERGPKPAPEPEDEVTPIEAYRRRAAGG